jgi:hypothetical protein
MAGHSLPRGKVEGRRDSEVGAAVQEKDITLDRLAEFLQTMA